MRSPFVHSVLLASWLFLCGLPRLSAAIFNVASGDVAGLIAAINTANSNGEADLINLAAGTYVLTSVNNNTNGPNGLPVIVDEAAVPLDLTVHGNGSVLRAQFNTAFRLLCIGAGASVNIDALTISNGVMHDGSSGGSPTAGFGAGIYNDGRLTLVGCTVGANNCDTTVGNAAGGAGGGGIYNSASGTLFLVTSVIGSNLAARNGAGVFNAGELNINSCTFASNLGNLFAGGSAGGAIYNAAGASVIMSNSTLSGNQASLGTGIYNRAGQVGISNSTLSNSGIYNDGSSGSTTVSFSSTILQSNSGANLTNSGGTFVSQGHNLSSDAAGGDGSTGPGGFLNGTGDIRNTNPLLSNISVSWGGRTATHNLLSRSPAIDKGVANGLTTDQRGTGFPRTIDLPGTDNGSGDGTDIGAVEFIPGTIPQKGQLIISEFRPRGPTFDAGAGIDGSSDEYVEIYNTSGTPIRINSVDGSHGIALAYTDGTGSAITTAGYIEENTIIPANGHYLFGGGSNDGNYNLGNYASPNSDEGPDIPDNAGIALFQTTNEASYSMATRLDAVSLNNSNGTYSSLFREGTALASPGANDGQYTYQRKQGNGMPQDTNDNSTDFTFVSTNAGNYGGVQSQLGAPGPEGLGHPIQSNTALDAQLIEPASGASAAPNLVRSLTAVANGAQGTLSLRRHYVNNSGSTITVLRFRIVECTTLNSPSPGGGQADLRALDSTDFSINTSRGALTVKGTTLQQPAPMQQPNGGGLNSSLSVALPAGGLAPGAAIDVQLLFGVQQLGSYRIAISTEATPGGGLGTLKVASTSHPANGHFAFSGTGQPSAPYIIQKSIDLVTYTQNSRIVGNLAGAWQFDDASAVGTTRGFYRVQAAPLLVFGTL